ncbi:Sec39 domain-containing protein [Myxozyma melibiosi]|uniref:Sec39 domain-containing protein n=1 Tax=Myxozyma melibiosi TaxID=54550 RepID=A0ABR1F9P3_9ASCO
MPDSSDGSDSLRLWLLAAYLASLSRTADLRRLFRSQYWSSPKDALAILLRFIPEAADPEPYVALVSDIARNQLDEDVAAGGDDSIELRDEFELEELMPSELRHLDDAAALQIRNSLLEAFAESQWFAKFEYYEHDAELTISSWIFARIYSIDSSLGVIAIVSDIVSLYSMPAAVVQWREGVLTPLQRFQSFYPQSFDSPRLFTLHDFTSVDPRRVIEYFLSYTTAKTVSRDVVSIVTPYVEFMSEVGGTYDMHPWRQFFEWMVATAAVKKGTSSSSSSLHSGRFGTILELAKTWNGPDDMLGDTQIEYISAVIAVCYQCEETTNEYFEAMHSMQKRATALLSSLTGRTPADEKEVKERMQEFPDFASAMKFPGSPLFQASETSLRILDHLITSASMVSVHVPTNLQAVTRLRFFASHEAEYQFLLKVVRGTSKEYAYRDDSNWRALRSGARWLKNKSMVLSRLSDADIENIFLGALLDFGRIGLVSEIYIDPVHAPLGVTDMEKHVLKAFEEHYDNASNCNATRGSLKTASQVLQLIYPHMTNSVNLHKADVLLKATHELSKYALTLVHGTPLTPVQVRANGDAEEIVSLLLQSNEKAYLQIDEMIKLTKDLMYGLTLEFHNVLAAPKTRSSSDHEDGGSNSQSRASSVPPEGMDEDMVEFRIARTCIYSALAADDFKTAHDYCMHRLWVHATEIAQLDSELVWQVFFAAGRYVSPNSSALTPSPGQLKGGISPMMALHLSGRVKTLRLQMDLLARAMDISPERNVFEILNVWQEFEVQVAQYVEVLS